MKKAATQKKRKKASPADCLFEDKGAGRYGWDPHEPCPEREEDTGAPVDVISGEIIEHDWLARVRCDGLLRCYDLETLNNLLETDPIDPFTRRPFTDPFIDRIIAETNRLAPHPVTRFRIEAIRRVHNEHQPLYELLGTGNIADPVIKTLVAFL
ncbi:unnamed protein product, partial [marine sediment metagenome]